ncbi:MAG: DUF1353 domain-containing protein [Dehalococcoidales bacterium]|jgi:hypothetical protein|nr:DUF1353 domain-containing protein [Dehalococcoidales bacterium]
MNSRYRKLKGWKYQLLDDYKIYVEIYPKTDIVNAYLHLTTGGQLTINAGYAWDGASGPTFDTPCTMRASLIHDVLYQMMRLGAISLSYRKYADTLLRDICIQDGMNKVRACLWYWAVRLFAGKAARPGIQREPEVCELGGDNAA